MNKDQVLSHGLLVGGIVFYPSPSFLVLVEVSIDGIF